MVTAGGVCFSLPSSVPRPKGAQPACCRGAAAAVLAGLAAGLSAVGMTDNEKTVLTLETLRREKRADILRLAKSHGARNVRVFGSVATGENGPDSDVDFLVDLEPGRTIFDLARLLGDLRDLLGRPVDVIESRSIHPYLRGRILDEAVVL